MKKLHEAKYRVDIEGVETDSATDMARLLQSAGVTDQKISVPSVQKSISPAVQSIPDFDFGPEPDISELTEAPNSVTHATEQEFGSAEEAVEYWRDEFQKAFSDDYESIEGAMSVQLEDMGYDQFEIERMVDQAMQGLTETVDYSDLLETVFADRDICDREGLREVFGTDEVSDSEIIRAYTLNSEDTDPEEALVRTADELGCTGEQVQKALEKAGFDVLTESTEIRCPECGLRHGKPQERAKEFSCSDCGTKIKNPKGYDLEESVNSIYAPEAESDYELSETVAFEGKMFQDLGKLSEGSVWSPGDNVVIKNARKYDSMAPSGSVEGKVIFVWDDGRVAVEVGRGQSNVDPEDLVLNESAGNAPHFKKKGDGYGILTIGDETWDFFGDDDDMRHEAQYVAGRFAPGKQITWDFEYDESDLLGEGETWDAVKKAADRMWNGTPEENKAEQNTREKFAKEKGLKGEPRIVQKFNEAENPWTSNDDEKQWTQKDEVELMDRLDAFLRKDSMAKAAMEDLQDPGLSTDDKKDIFRDLVSDMTGTANSIIDDMYPASPSDEDIQVIVRSVLRAWKVKPLV